MHPRPLRGHRGRLIVVAVIRVLWFVAVGCAHQLGRHQLRIQAALLEELLVATLLHCFSTIQNNNAVSIAYG